MSQFGVETQKKFLLAPLAALFCTQFSKLWHRRYINFVTDLQLAPDHSSSPHFSNQIYATARGPWWSHKCLQRGTIIYVSMTIGRPTLRAAFGTAKSGLGAVAPAQPVLFFRHVAKLRRLGTARIYRGRQ